MVLSLSDGYNRKTDVACWVMFGVMVGKEGILELNPSLRSTLL